MCQYVYDENAHLCVGIYKPGCVSLRHSWYIPSKHKQHSTHTHTHQQGWHRWLHFSNLFKTDHMTPGNSSKPSGCTLIHSLTHSPNLCQFFPLALTKPMHWVSGVCVWVYVCECLYLIDFSVSAGAALQSPWWQAGSDGYVTLRYSEQKAIDQMLQWLPAAYTVWCCKC